MAQETLPRISLQVAVPAVGNPQMSITSGRVRADGYFRDYKKPKRCQRCGIVIHRFSNLRGDWRWFAEATDAKTGEAIFVEHTLLVCDARRAKAGRR